MPDLKHELNTAIQFTDTDKQPKVVLASCNRLQSQTVELYSDSSTNYTLSCIRTTKKLK